MSVQPRAWLLFLTLFAAPWASSQDTRGTILGTVRDASGAAVPNAIVVVTRVDTNASREMKTTEEGFFSVPYLVIGDYRVAVSAPGFKQWVAVRARRSRRPSFG